MAEVVRKKVKWATGKRRGKSRVWKTKWVIVRHGEGSGGGGNAGGGRKR